MSEWAWIVPMAACCLIVSVLVVLVLVTHVRDLRGCRRCCGFCARSRGL